jgi:hypothetical protein
MDQELKQYLDANFARIDERFVETEARLNARIEKVETSLLGAFLAEQRISELERRRAS